MIDIVRDFLLEPVILIGVIVFIGLVLQRKGFEVVVKGTLKAMIGFMIISIGGNIISCLLYTSTTLALRLDQIANESEESGPMDDLGI